MVCVVEEVGDLWALERAGAWSGLYHVLGGTLSAIEGVRPEDLAIGALIERAGRRRSRKWCWRSTPPSRARPRRITSPSG